MPNNEDRLALASWIAEQDMARILRERNANRNKRFSPTEETWFRGPVREGLHGVGQ